MYVAPALWVGLAVLAVVRLLNAIWLVIVGESANSILPFPAGINRVVKRKECRKGGGEGSKDDADVVRTAVALILTITNTVAFSRCDKFSQASNLANSAFIGGGFARGLAGNMVGRLFR